MNPLAVKLFLCAVLVVGLVTYHHYDKTSALTALNASWRAELEKANATYLEKEKSLVAALHRNNEVQHERIARAENDYRALATQLGRLRKQIEDNRQRATAVAQASSGVNGTGESGILIESIEENARLAREADRLALKVQGLQDYINTILKAHENGKETDTSGSPL